MALSSAPQPATATWLGVVSHLDPRYGGLSAVVPQLCASLASTQNLAIELAAFCLPGEFPKLEEMPNLSTTVWPSSRLAWWRSNELKSRFHRLAREAAGLHIHGLWEQSTSIAASTARLLRKPYLISAHGMLDMWALRHRRRKKQIYAALCERRNVGEASCLHALTGAEADDYRRFGAKGPIAVIPNAVSVPEAIEDVPFLARFPELGGKRIVLFLSRIHPKKGLDILVDAWADVCRRWPEAHLVLAGPDFESTRPVIEARVRERGLTDRVLFTGMLDHALKWSALAAAECFVLPSYSEGLSISVMEAMGAGVPVIVTTHCHMPQVQECGAGWEIESDSRELASALSDLLSNSSTANRKIGASGARLIAEEYSWPSVAARMAEVYRWLDGGPAPHSVDLRVNEA